MSKLFLVVLVLLSQACALTAPEGTKELMEDIKRDKALPKRESPQFVGKPVFVKVRAYPRIEDANIHGRSWILLKVGNERIDLDPLINSISSER